MVQQLTHADAVFVLGIQSTRGIANAFFSHLEYLRPRVSYSEGLSGSWVESLNSGFANPYIVLTDTRAYSAIARQYCRVASEKGLAMALITDICWGKRCRNVWQSTDNYNKNLVNLNAKGAELCLKRVN